MRSGLQILWQQRRQVTFGPEEHVRGEWLDCPRTQNQRREDDFVPHLDSDPVYRHERRRTAIVFTQFYALRRYISNDGLWPKLAERERQIPTQSGRSHRGRHTFCRNRAPSTTVL